jgi:hypothetical protein
MKRKIPVGFGATVQPCLDDFEPFVRAMLTKHGGATVMAALVEILAQGTEHPVTRRLIYKRLERGFRDVRTKPPLGLAPVRR